jgi:hypothetical protein
MTAEALRRREEIIRNNHEALMRKHITSGFTLRLSTSAVKNK